MLNCIAFRTPLFMSAQYQILSHPLQIAPNRLSTNWRLHCQSAAAQWQLAFYRRWTRHSSFATSASLLPLYVAALTVVTSAPVRCYMKAASRSLHSMCSLHFCQMHWGKSMQQKQMQIARSSSLRLRPILRHKMATSGTCASFQGFSTI